MDNSVPLSDIPHLYANEIIPYHEAGHAVMARLYGINVEYIELYLIVEGTYQGIYFGKTAWDRDRPIHLWDPNIPYNELGLQQGVISNIEVALVYAAGKAAERIWYRQRSLDETLASYGSGRDNDERQLEEVLTPPSDLSRLIPVDLPKRIQEIENKAMQLLEAKICWQAVEAIAQTLLEGLKQTPNNIMLSDVQNRIADVFAQAALNEKT